MSFENVLFNGAYPPVLLIGYFKEMMFNVKDQKNF